MNFWQGLFGSGSDSSGATVDTANITTNTNQGTPTLNGTSDLGIFGSLATLGTNIYTAVKGSQNKSEKNTETKQPLQSGISKNIWIIGGALVGVVLLILLLRRK